MFTKQMSTPSTNQKSVDFSRKCRDRVNFFFQKLKISLQKIPDYQSSGLNWNRFEILERALQQIQMIDGSNRTNFGTELATDPSSNRKDMNNKELCQLYRTRLNLGFEKLRNILEQKPELRQFRLFSRAGLLEATIHYLETQLPSHGLQMPKPSLKRERTDEDDEVISPNKIPKPYFTNQFPVIQYPNLNNSTGLESPESGSSPINMPVSHQSTHILSLELVRAQLIAYNRLMMLRSASQMILREPKSETPGVWRPW